MKKLVCLFLAAILFITGAITAFAAGPQQPVINSQMPDCYGVAGGDYITLFTDATTSDGGTLTYQWYSTTVNDISTISAIFGAEGSMYTPPQTVGVVYYCYGVWNTRGGITSSPVYSRLIRVEYEEYEPAPVGLEIISTPNKVVYTSGECLDLTGLKVRIWTSEGYIDSVNGDMLEITKSPLVTVGEQKIKVSYGDAYEFFVVTVNEAAHTHSFSEWIVTTEPTCTETGIKARECGCGHTERADIAAKGHKWDGGKVTKEPTKTTNGEKTFTCTVCGKKKTEVIKADDDSSDESSSESSDDSSKEEKLRSWFKKLGSLKTGSDDSSQTDSSDDASDSSEKIVDKSAKASDKSDGADSDKKSGFPLSVLLIAGGIGFWIIICIIIVVVIAKKDKKKRSQINGGR